MFFTDNTMVTEMYEIDVEPLRKVINRNRDVLKALWLQLLPGVMLLIQKQLDLPHFLMDKEWH